MTEFGDQELINEFLVESYDNLDQLDQDFVALEQNPSDLEMLSRIFRCIHTIKGTCGFLGFSKLESVAHVGENLLSRLRDGELSLTPEMTSGLLEMVDAVREILGNIERDGGEGHVDYSNLIATLEALQTGAPMSPKEESKPAVEVETPIEAETEAPIPDPKPAPEATGSRLGELLVERGDATPDDIAEALLKQLQGDSRRLGQILVESGVVREQVLELILEEQKDLQPHTVGELLMHSGVVGAEDVAKALQAQLEGDDRAVGEILEDQGKATKEEVAEALATQAAQQEAQKDAAPQQTSVSDSTIRVDVHLLDKVMNMVGELVLSRNQIMQFSTTQEDMTFIAACQRLNLVTTELQEGVMKTRMQPIGNVWNKFPRIVRDLSKSVGKKIRIEMEGEDTELDKTILEAIKDPLTHIVRNSVDHGLEGPEERAMADKDEEGVLKLRAYHEGGQVIIEIADDGGGINVERVRNKAVEKNVITADQAKRMSDHEAVNLIFAAGLSTAKEVTNISGRGVGMDVVRTNIEKIGGTVDVTSETGVGTTLRVKIPLTLAIIPALIVTTGEDRYAIPQVSLLELVRLEGRDGERAIEYIHGSPVYRLRGRLLPLIHLGQELGVTDAGANGPVAESAEPVDAEHEAAAESEVEPEAMNIVVLQAEGRQFGLVVEHVHDTEEIVVKPLSKQLKNISAFAGATIMGDGKVALILDVLGIAQQANVVTRNGDKALAEAQDQNETTDHDRQAVLLFKTTEDDRMAMPLDLVDRLEEFPHESVEKAGALHVVQYRDAIMPLVEVGGHVTGFDNGHDNGQGEQDPIHVVVFSLDGKSIGLRVGQILDITEEDLSSKGQAGRNGVLFTAVIQGKVTEFIDTAAVVQQSIPGFTSGVN